MNIITDNMIEDAILQVKYLINLIQFNILRLSGLIYKDYQKILILTQKYYLVFQCRLKKILN